MARLSDEVRVDQVEKNPQNTPCLYTQTSVLSETLALCTPTPTCSLKIYPPGALAGAPPKAGTHSKATPGYVIAMQDRTLNDSRTATRTNVRVALPTQLRSGGN